MTFIFVFLPIVVALYYLVRKELRNYVLLLSSVVFYAWGEPQYFLVMILIVAVNYFCALLMERFSSFRRFFVTLALLSDFGVLGYFKYTDFLIENLNALLHCGIDPIKVVMPIGISFYIFQSVSYLIDVYRREIPPQRDFYKLFLFIALFPQMIAGPILKYHDVAGQIEHRIFAFEQFSYGVKRFIIGLAKKVLVANVMGAVADRIFEAAGIHYPFWMNWVGAAAYTFQIYYDFSGYSDMAIGLGAVFGFRFQENFNYPYISRSITEFWRRWHISLSTWFKEYLYIPLGGNRVSTGRNLLNLSIVFIATGVWHGASWNFVIWGVWHGFFIIMEKLTGLHKREFGLCGRFCCHLYTILVFLFGWVLFRSDTVAEAWIYVKRMFGVAAESRILLSWQTYFGYGEPVIFGVAALCSFPLFRGMIEIPARAGTEGTVPRWQIGKAVLTDLWLLILFVLSVTRIATSTYNPFIYFRF